MSDSAGGRSPSHNPLSQPLAATDATGAPGLAVPVAGAPSLWRRLSDLVFAHRRALVIVLTLTASLYVRCNGLGTYGFSEDESNKLNAIRAYERLDFRPNAEHPMLMKLAMLASMEGADAWNAFARQTRLPVVSPEAALRFPNALAGALTTLVIFLLTESMFGLRTAAWASFLWAFDVNAVSISRIGKEDTLLVLFLFTAALMYRYGKRDGATDPARGERWYTRAGAAFGLMAASKYMPYYYGLHAMYARVSDPDPGRNRPDKRKFYAAMAAAFLVANFTVLAPSTWAYILSYVHGDTTRHTGYYFAHRLYVNMPADSPWGLPVWFYLAFLGLKVPIPILAAFLLGVGRMVKKRREDGYIFLRIFIVFFLLPFSLIAGKFARYMLPFLFVMDIAAAVGIIWLLERLRNVHWQRAAVAVAASAAVAVFSWSPVYATVSSAPFYSLYRNAVGASLGPPGWMFPDDEMYDAGLREAVRHVARFAAPGAVVSSDAPGVVREYLDRAGRTDIESRSLSRQGASAHLPNSWVVAQDAHTYFENEQLLKTLRLRPPDYVVSVDGGISVQVFRNER